jgi:Mg-chelatase subunit ChlD
LAGVRRETADVDQTSTLNAEAYFSILEQASSVIHRQATLICGSQRFIEGIDPEVPYLANLCHRRILKLAELTLNEFWASLQQDSRPYCLEKAQRLLELAQAIRRNYGTRVGEQLQQQLENRLQALEENESQFADVSRTPNQITLAPAGLGESRPGSILLKPKQGVPEGLGAVWLAAGLDSVPLAAIRIPSSDKPISRLPIAISPDSIATTWSLDRRMSQQLEDQQIRALDFIAWFRGHRFADAIRVAPASENRTTQWNSSQNTPTKVTVNGEVSEVRSVAIIFDCSGSMGQRMADGRTRLDAGRTALAQLLNNLVTLGNWDVSLWLYGHRTQWTRDSRGRYSFKLTSLGEKAKADAAKAEMPFKLVPGDDVEQVLPMQALTPGVVAEIETILAPLSAGGETPLYRAISEAIGTDFDGPHQSIPGHVLVVTDGANDQSGGQIVTASGVADQLARKNLRRPLPLRIDIIGFALEADAMQRALRMGEVRDLAVESGGTFHEAADPTALTSSLRQSLQLLQWQIVDKRFADQRFRLGESTTLPVSPPGQLRNYDIVLEAGGSGTSRRIAAENNTSLDLFVSGGGRSLEFRRYDGGTEQGLRDSRSGVVDPLDPRRQLFFGVHLANRAGNLVTLPLSVQNDDAQSYSQRPTSIWVEVQPLVRDKPTGNPYVFYDMQLQQERSVPVFDLRALEWPRQARSAAIRAWVRFDNLKPDIAIAIRDLPSGQSKRLGFPGLPNSTISIARKPSSTTDHIEVTVTEQHPAELASQLPLLRVQVSENCSEAIHTVEPDSGQVLHRFLITAESGGLSPATLLELTDRQRITAGAVSTVLSDATQLIVPIPPE